MTELPAIVQSAIQAALQAQLNLDLESLRAWQPGPNPKSSRA